MIFIFSTKGSIHVISVGMERSTGIPMEIFCLNKTMRVYLNSIVVIWRILKHVQSILSCLFYSLIGPVTQWIRRLTDCRFESSRDRLLLDLQLQTHQKKKRILESFRGGRKGVGSAIIFENFRHHHMNWHIAALSTILPVTFKHFCSIPFQRRST